MILPLFATALIADATSAMISPERIYHGLSRAFREEEEFERTAAGSQFMIYRIALVRATNRTRNANEPSPAAKARFDRVSWAARVAA